MTTKSLSLLILGFILTLIYFLPASKFSFSDYSITCLHQRILGFECPGCGMTRAIHSFLHFDFKGAANLNFAVFGLFPFLIFRTTSGLMKTLDINIFKRVSAIIFISLLSFQYILRIPL